MKFPEIKEIYHYLQGKSSQYPNIDTTTMREHFLKALAVNKLYEIDVIMREVTGNLDPKIREEKKPGWTRFMFIEVLFRLARLLYSSISNGGNKNEFNSYKHISVSKAFDLFFQCDLKPYRARVGVNWQVFRDNKLHDYEVELVFTMNMPSIDRIYSKYSKMHQNTEHKAHNQVFMVLHDCIQLFTHDSKLKLNKRLVREAFALSKQTVVAELEPEGMLQYRKLAVPEFLEVIARIAELSFRDSEMEDVELYQKVEHVLDDILPVIDAKRIKQVITVEEFSDSDDDY